MRICNPIVNWNSKNCKSSLLLFDVPNTRTLLRVKRLEIVFVLKNKGHDKIDYYRAAESKKWKIYKIHPYSSGPDP